MGSNQHRALMAFVVGVSSVGCIQAPPAAGGLPPVACLVDDDPATATLALSEALVRIPPPAIELFLDVDSGGPLRCRPSNEPCAALADCAGSPVPVPIGTEAVLAVGVRRVAEETTVTVNFVDIALTGGTAFTLLEPTPQDFTFDEPEVFLLVAVTPSAEGVISAELRIQTDARNMPADGAPLSVTLQVEGVLP